MKFLSRWLPLFRFDGSRKYWETRYELGGDSGGGSEGEAAKYKADVINAFVRNNRIGDVIEFGCGDGRQLLLADYPRYIGIDVSGRAVDMCRERFCDDSTKRFEVLEDYRGECAALSLSLDVLYHLIEDDIYAAYLQKLFSSGREYVVIYSTSTSIVGGRRSLSHVRHRQVESDVAKMFPDFQRMHAEEIALPAPVEKGAGGFTKFFFYKRGGVSSD